LRADASDTSNGQIPEFLDTILDMAWRVLNRILGSNVGHYYGAGSLGPFVPLLRDYLPKFETAWKHQDRVSIVQPANRNVFLSFKRFNISTTGL